MPQTTLRLFRKKNGEVPLREWLDDLEGTNPQVYEKCLAAILELARLGFEARRPLAAPLRDGIYELRVTVKRVHFRMLYFFSGKNEIVLSHGCTKEDVVPDIEITRAIAAKKLVDSDPTTYTTT